MYRIPFIPGYEGGEALDVSVDTDGHICSRHRSVTRSVTNRTDCFMFPKSSP